MKDLFTKCYLNIISENIYKIPLFEKLDLFLKNSNKKYLSFSCKELSHFFQTNSIIYKWLKHHNDNYHKLHITFCDFENQQDLQDCVIYWVKTLNLNEQQKLKLTRSLSNAADPYDFPYYGFQLTVSEYNSFIFFHKSYDIQILIHEFSHYLDELKGVHNNKISKHQISIYEGDDIDDDNNNLYILYLDIFELSPEEAEYIGDTNEYQQNLNDFCLFLKIIKQRNPQYKELDNSTYVKLIANEFLMNYKTETPRQYLNRIKDSKIIKKLYNSHNVLPYSVLAMIYASVFYKKNTNIKNNLFGYFS